jgi:endonuclease G
MSLMNRWYRARWLLLLLVLAACAPALRQAPPAGAKTEPEQAALSVADQEKVARQCPFGAPRLDSSQNWGTVRLIARDGYVLAHSSSAKVPLWVCEGLVAAQLEGTLTRDSDPFKPDPLLPKGERSELVDYEHSGLDRGHMAPAGDQTTDATLKAETFYLSNMAPQVPALNRQVWAALEAMVRKWVKERGSARVVTGPIFSTAEAPDAGETSLPQTIGPDAVRVPSQFFKVVVANAANGQAEAIAFVLENRAYERPWDFSPLIRPIDWIEALTGLDLLPELSAAQQEQLESSPSPLWE